MNARSGNEKARNLRDIFGWSRPFEPHIAGETICTLLQNADALERSGGLCKSTLRVATLRGRLYLHSAFPTTQPDSVFFGPDTYRFVRSALAALTVKPYARAIDLGCGGGACGMEIAAALDIGQLWLSDINPAALVLAGINAAAAGQRASFAESDLFAAVDGRFDLIVANPPFLADLAKRAYRDGGGALGMELGLRIVREGIDRLTVGGVMFLYTGVPIVDGIDKFRVAVEQILSCCSCLMDYSEIDPDVFGEELEKPAYGKVDRIAAIALKITFLGRL